MESSLFESCDRLLVHTPFGKDAQHLCKVLGAENFHCRECTTIEQLVAEIAPSATAILTTEEIFSSSELPLLVRALKEQPTWSAIPVLLFYTSRQGSEQWRPRMAEAIEEITDIIFVQRPLSKPILLGAIQGAVRDRRRQYRTRHLLEQLQEDISQRTRYEAQLKKAHAESQEAKEAAETANRFKSQFLANMSHEIRTPLGAILGFAELISLPETTKDETDSYISVIRRNSQQLLTIIDDILNLAKVESGKLALETIQFPLPDLLEDVESLLGLRAREKGIEFAIKAAPDLPLQLSSDPTRLKQVLMNVAGNAIKFTKAGRVDCAVSFQDGLLSFEVTDTGRGISEEQREILFQPFTQADASTTRKFGGTGLGLVITKRLCEAMGGDFFLKESEPGRGSTFVAQVRVETPQVRSVVPAAPVAPTVSQPLLGMKVLLVEDSPDNQTLLCIFLSKAGAEVELAVDGVEGVEKALQCSYTVIIMDVQMPRMGGIEAVQTLRARGLSLPIVALTAHAMRERYERCMAAGFTSFLSKPVHKETLIRVLRDARN